MLYVITILLTFICCSGDDAVENEDDDDDVIDDNNNDDERMSNQDEDIVHALVAADALGRGSKSTNTDPDHISEALEKLDMDNYDEEDDGNLYL